MGRLLIGIVIGMILMLVLQTIAVFIIYQSVGSGNTSNIINFVLKKTNPMSFFMTSPMQPMKPMVPNQTLIDQHINNQSLEIGEPQ